MMSKRNRKCNPYRLTADEKLAVVELYARFATSEEVIDTVMSWKPQATTGDTAKDKKYVTDAIRTCNPNSRVFSFHVALQERRAAYLSERSGTFVATVSDMLSKLAAAIPDLEFDFKMVSVTELPKLVSALKALFSLMTAINIAPFSEVAKARNFSSKLDEYPQHSPENPHNIQINTRREMLAEAEALETIHAEQMENGTARSADDISEGRYPQNYVFPDLIVELVWEELTGNYDVPKKPSCSQMLKDISERTNADGQFIDGAHEGEYWWELVADFETRLTEHRQHLSSEWSSLSPAKKKLRAEVTKKVYMETALSDAKALGIDLNAMGDRKNVLTELFREIRAEKKKRSSLTT